MTTNLHASDFIAKATDLHNGKYDYSLVNYVSTRTHVTIVCPIHGNFSQRPDIHLKSMGCQQCAKAYRLATRNKRPPEPDRYFENCRRVHGDRYDYSQSVYVRGSEPIDIVCNTHGTFTIARAEKHFMRAQGCPHCVTGSSNAERAIAKVLLDLNVLFYREYKFDDCISPFSEKSLRFDFYIPDRKLIIEYHGVQHFKENTLMHPNEGDFQRSLEKDAYKKQFAHDKGLTMVVLTSKSLKSVRETVAKILE